MTTIELPTREAWLWDVDDETYHACRWSISSTMVKDFIASPKLFWARYVCGMYPRKATAAMELGTLVHQCILFPGYRDFLTCVPQETRRGSKDWMAAEESGCLVLKADEYDDLQRMLAAVDADPNARHFLRVSPANVEQPIVWRDQRTGLLLRCKPDHWAAGFDGHIVDLKTARDVEPRGFASAVVNLGYHISAAMYRAGVAAVDSWQPWVAIAIQNQPPYDVAVYDLDDELLKLGEAKLTEALDGIRQCIELDDWRPWWQRQITTLSAPRWAYYQDEWSDTQ